MHTQDKDTNMYNTIQTTVIITGKHHLPHDDRLHCVSLNLGKAMARTITNEQGLVKGCKSMRILS
jgi:hypothetical protein